MATARAVQESVTEATTAVRHAETTEQDLARRLTQQNCRTAELRDTITDTAHQLAEGDPMPTSTTATKSARKQPTSSKRRPAVKNPATGNRTGSTNGGAAKKTAAASSAATSRSTAATKKFARKSDTTSAKKSPAGKKATTTKKPSGKPSSSTNKELREARSQLDALRDREKKLAKRVEKHDKTVKALKKDLKRSEKTLGTVHDNLDDAKKARRKAQKRLTALA